MNTETLMRELRHALRSMARTPGFTLIVVPTLALGIGATTAIFAMLDRVVLHALPYADSGRLVWLDSPVPASVPRSGEGSPPLDSLTFRRTRALSKTSLP